MLKFNEILIVFCTLIGLGLAGAPLRIIEGSVKRLAVEATQHGYMSLSTLNQKLAKRSK